MPALLLVYLVRCRRTRGRRLSLSRVPCRKVRPCPLGLHRLSLWGQAPGEEGTTSMPPGETSLFLLQREDVEAEEAPR